MNTQGGFIRMNSWMGAPPRAVPSRFIFAPQDHRGHIVRRFG